MPPARIRRYLRHGRLSQLAVFEASARHGCYTRAARELHLAQPTVSAQIKKLSYALGMPLFEQVGKRMQLTEAGRCLQAACAEVFGALSRLDDALADLRSIDAGRLSLAGSTSDERTASQLVATLEVEGFLLQGLSFVYPAGKTPGPAARAILEFARKEPG